MNFALQNSLVDDSFTTSTRGYFNTRLIEGETVTIYLEDNSNYFSQEDHRYMKEIIKQIDEIIDLDFAFTNNYNVSDIDIITGDSVSEFGNHTVHDSWVTVEAYADPSLSWSANMNNFTQYFLTTLGLASPKLDSRWDQDDTVMSFNSGDNVDWQIAPTNADYNALASIWGYENDIEDDSWSSTWVPPVLVGPPPIMTNQGDVIFNNATPTYTPVGGPPQIITNQGGVIFNNETPMYL